MDKWCGSCRNAKWCKYIHPYIGHYCPGMEMVIDNKSPRKEPLASDLIGEGYEGFTNKDYKDVLGEVRESKDEEHRRRHEQIMDMPDNTTLELRMKMIAAALFFNIPHAKVIKVLHLAERTFYRLVTGK